MEHDTSAPMMQFAELLLAHDDSSGNTGRFVETKEALFEWAETTLQAYAELNFQRNAVKNLAERDFVLLVDNLESWTRKVQHFQDLDDGANATDAIYKRQLARQAVQDAYNQLLARTKEPTS